VGLGLKGLLIMLMEGQDESIVEERKTLGQCMSIYNYMGIGLQLLHCTSNAK
jgi:hypothetical protein